MKRTKREKTELMSTFASKPEEASWKVQLLTIGGLKSRRTRREENKVNLSRSDFPNLER